MLFIRPHLERKCLCGVAYQGVNMPRALVLRC